MKTKKLLVLLSVILSIGLLAAFRMNKIFSSSDSNKTIVNVNLIWSTYTNDHVAIEYSVQGQIVTPYGTLAGCPVGGSQVLNGKGNLISGNNNDFTYCRPDGNGGYLVTQFFYSDYGKNKPEKVKIKIGDVDDLDANNGTVVHIAPVGDFYFSVSSQSDAQSVSYPSNIAQAASGLNMKIKRVDFSPSLAKVDACVTLPDTGDWLVDGYMINAGQNIPLTYWTIPNYKNPGVLDNVQRCFSFVFTGIPDYTTIKKGDLSFVVDKVSRNVPECVKGANWEKIKDELQKYGIDSLQPDAGGNYCFAGAVDSLPESENASLNLWIENALKEEVQGPLTITVK
ncbi:MAG: hypothetical protein OZ914_03950 [Anaerolineaceae bacterium]|jgi:hypothetical protein|nr:hypothetical protein [Anaerolineaceae bacterium]OQY89701.1 MAG: hypothetical protein B6D38_05920 [Anaerolineae bacterium UTCFX1]